MSSNVLSSSCVWFQVGFLSHPTLRFSHPFDQSQTELATCSCFRVQMSPESIVNLTAAISIAMSFLEPVNPDIRAAHRRSKNVGSPTSTSLFQPDVLCCRPVGVQGSSKASICYGRSCRGRSIFWSARCGQNRDLIQNCTSSALRKHVLWETSCWNRLCPILSASLMHSVHWNRLKTGSWKCTTWFYMANFSPS